MSRNFILIILTVFLLSSCAKQTEKIKDISQINGKRICVLTGSAGDLTARRLFPDSRFLDIAGSADAALAVKTGKADAFIYDKGVLDKIIEKNPDLTILDKPVSKLDVAIALNKNNNNLRSRINEVLHQLREEGILDALKKKWVDTKYSQAPAIAEEPNSGANGILRMGTCAIYEPFTFKSFGKYTGLDIELIMLIGSRLSMKVDITDMNFDALIPALQSNKIDLAISNFNVTEERKKSISYSDPYIGNDISVLVKK